MTKSQAIDLLNALHAIRLEGLSPVDLGDAAAYLAAWVDTSDDPGLVAMRNQLWTVVGKLDECFGRRPAAPLRIVE